MPSLSLSLRRTAASETKRPQRHRRSITYYLFREFFREPSKTSVYCQSLGASEKRASVQGREGSCRNNELGLSVLPQSPIAHRPLCGSSFSMNNELLLRTGTDDRMESYDHLYRSQICCNGIPDIQQRNSKQQKALQQNSHRNCAIRSHNRLSFL